MGSILPWRENTQSPEDMAGKDLGSTQSMVYFHFQMVQERLGTVTVVVSMRMAP